MSVPWTTVIFSAVSSASSWYGGIDGAADSGTRKLSMAPSSECSSVAVPGAHTSIIAWCCGVAPPLIMQVVGMPSQSWPGPEHALRGPEFQSRQLPNVETEKPWHSELASHSVWQPASPTALWYEYSASVQSERRHLPSPARKYASRKFASMQPEMSASACPNATVVSATWSGLLAHRLLRTPLVVKVPTSINRPRGRPVTGSVGPPALGRPALNGTPLAWPGTGTSPKT